MGHSIVFNVACFIAGIFTVFAAIGHKLKHFHPETGCRFCRKQHEHQNHEDIEDWQYD